MVEYKVRKEKVRDHNNNVTGQHWNVLECRPGNRPWICVAEFSRPVDAHNYARYCNRMVRNRAV